MDSRIITVVGGTGFIGRYVVKRLAKAGYRVRVISRNPEAALPLKTAGDPGQIVLLGANLAKPESFTGMLEGSYAVVNLVGILFESGKQSVDTLQSRGAESLAKAAKSAGVQRFIQLSAIGVDRASGSHYARTKLLGEKAVQAAFPGATILRPSVVFGAEDQFFNEFAKMAQFAPALPLIGGGTTQFQPVYVDDVAHAIEISLQDDRTMGETYELGGPKIYSFRQILELITRTIHKPRALVTIPFAAAGPIALGAEIAYKLVPVIRKPALTRDQLKLLKHDNVVSPKAKTFANLGIQPTSVESVVPAFLARFAPYTKVA